MHCLLYAYLKALELKEVSHYKSSDLVVYLSRLISFQKGRKELYLKQDYGDGLEVKQPAGGWASDSSPYEVSTNIYEPFDGWMVGKRLRTITGSLCI